MGCLALANAADNPLAKTKSGNLPTVDEVLAKNLQAIGGKAALERIKSRSIKGKMELASLGLSDVAWEQVQKAPNKRYIKMEFPGMTPLVDVFDGVNNWSKDPEGKVLEKKGEELARTRRECEIHRELKLKELYQDLRVKGKQKVGDRDAYAIEAKPATGDPETFCFDTETGLLVEWDSSFATEGGKVQIKVRYRDHREVDGLRLPFSTAVEVTPPNGQVFNLTVRCTEIQHNVPIQESQFAKPAE